MRRSVHYKIVRCYWGRKGHDGVEGSGEWFILCNRGLPTNSSVDARKMFYRR